jgi:AcrR family transcriptional regulator
VYRIQSCIVRRREVTVERLLDAALDTFAERGFAAASVEDVCRRGGFTRGAFYSSFTSKDELFAALFTRELAREMARVEQLLTGLADEPDPVTAAVDRCLSAFRTDRTWTLVATEYALHAARHPAAAELLQRHREELYAQLTGLIERAATEAGVRLAVPARQLASTIAALHDGVSLLALSQPGTPEIERPALLLLLRGAVLPPPPESEI